MHYNKISFVETIKSKIRDAALNDFDSLKKNIIFMMDNLTINYPFILNTYLFKEFKQCSVPLFIANINELHLNYLEAQLHIVSWKFTQMTA